MERREERDGGKEGGAMGERPSHAEREREQEEKEGQGKMLAAS